MNGRDSGPVSKGHLNPAESAPVHRYPAPPELAGLVRHFWVPEWDLPDGERVVARVLGYPALNVVVESGGAMLVGPTLALSERVLEGRGWAVGVLLRPAASPAFVPDVHLLVDRATSLPEAVPGLVGRVTDAMEADRPREERHADALAAVTRWLAETVGLAPLHGVPTPDGELANRAVDAVEDDPALGRVADLADRLGVSSRTLQRAVRRCTGFTPAEVIRRRRLHEATDRLVREPAADLAAVAQDTGFADQAHMTRAFRSTLAETPHRFRPTAHTQDRPD